MTRIGNGYLGSPSLQTSSSNQEIIPSPPSSWNQSYQLYKLSFLNDQDCHVLINNTVTLFLRAGQGFEMNKTDAPITSFIVVDSGITFNWVGAF